MTIGIARNHFTNMRGEVSRKYEAYHHEDRGAHLAVTLRIGIRNRGEFLGRSSPQDGESLESALRRLPKRYCKGRHQGHQAARLLLQPGQKKRVAASARSQTRPQKESQGRRRSSNPTALHQQHKSISRLIWRPRRHRFSGCSHSAALQSLAGRGAAWLTAQRLGRLPLRTARSCAVEARVIAQAPKGFFLIT